MIKHWCRYLITNSIQKNVRNQKNRSKISAHYINTKFKTKTLFIIRNIPSNIEINQRKKKPRFINEKRAHINNYAAHPHKNIPSIPRIPHKVFRDRESLRIDANPAGLFIKNVLPSFCTWSGPVLGRPFSARKKSGPLPEHAHTRVIRHNKQTLLFSGLCILGGSISYLGGRWLCLWMLFLKKNVGYIRIFMLNYILD